MVSPISLLFAVGLPLVAIGVGWWGYRDAGRRGHDELAPWIGFVIAGLFLAGSVPGLVALVIGDVTAVQGFPTAIRVVPGFAATAVYLRFR